MSFAITVDSTADLTSDEYASWDITVVPLSIEVDGEVFVDQVDLTNAEFYQRMQAAENLPKSSQPTPLMFEQTFTALNAPEDSEGVLSLHIADVLSGTYQSAVVGADQAKGEVRVINSYNASAGLGLLAKLAKELHDQGLSLDETVIRINQAIKEVRFIVAPDTLDNLLKGGRLAAEEAQQITALNIKPIFSFNEKGVLVAHGKARGMNGVIRAYIEEIQQMTEEYGTLQVRFCHTGNEAAVEKLKKALDEAGVVYEDAGTCECGATVATHLGLGAVGIGVMPCQR